MSYIIVLTLIVLVLLAFLRSRVLISSDHLAVKERLGRFVSKLEPGIHFIIPFIETVKIVDAETKTLHVKELTIESKNKHSLLLNIDILYHVSDVEMALYKISDLEKSLTLAASSIAKKILASQTAELITSELPETEKQIASELSKVCKSWGLMLEGVVVTQSPGA
jgi:regulator of protease activity HflC (stomatin/prohibitin superfamily)